MSGSSSDRQRDREFVTALQYSTVGHGDERYGTNLSLFYFVPKH